MNLSNSSSGKTALSRITLSCITGRLLLPAALLAIPAMAAADSVELRDGMVIRGRVVEMGGNAVEVRLSAGASRRVPLREIRKVVLKAEEEPLAAEADLVFRKNNTQVQGDVVVSEDGLDVVVTLADGSRINIPRGDVKRIVLRDQVRELNVGVYTEAVKREIAGELARVKKGGPEASAAEETLRHHGIFALEEVEKARQAAAADSPARQALDRVVRFYRLREVTTDALQELVDYYRILSVGTLEEKRSLLEEMFTRYPEESVPVAKFLIRDGVEEAAVRAWAVDLLGRLQRNRDLLDIYNDPAGGQIQLAAAMAMARNRLLIGGEALVQALEMDEPGVREIAIRTLRDAVGSDFDYHAHDTPSARKDAVAKWRRWWEQNRASFQAQAESMLSGRFLPGESPERRKALEYWKQGWVAWERGKHAEAETALRAAVKTDPLFINAQVSLGVLLYLHREKNAEGMKILEDLLGRRLPEMTAADTTWIHYYLGHAAELGGDLEKAEMEYRRALGVDPKFFRATSSLGDLKFHLAIAGEKLDPDQRRAFLGEAQSLYQTAIEAIDRHDAELETLALSDLPVSVAPAFERQEHNRGILEVKSNLRRRKAEMHFSLAKIRSLLDDRPRAVSQLSSAIEALGDQRIAGARELLVELYNYRAFLQEEAGDLPGALQDYRRVLQNDLDPRNAAAMEALRRLKAKTPAPRPAKPGEDGAPARRRGDRVESRR